MVKSTTEAFLQLDASFVVGLSRPYNWRRKQLQGIHDLIQNNAESLVHAALMDKRLLQTEVLLELASVLQLIRTELDAIKLSRTVKSIKTDVLGLHHQKLAIREASYPAGVVLVTSHWAFPYSSTLGSLALAFSSGNVAALVPSPSNPAITNLLKTLLHSFVDQLGYVLVDPSVQLSKFHVPLVSDIPSPAITALRVARNGSISSYSPCTVSQAPAAVYIHSTALSGYKSGSKQRVNKTAEIATAIVQSKLAFNGQTSLAPWIALVDDEIYNEIVDELKAAVDGSPIRKTVCEEITAKDVVNVIISNGAKILRSEPLYVLEDDSTKIGHLDLPTGRMPFLMVCRVSSPDTAIDHIQAWARLSAFYLYAEEPFLSYITQNVASSVTITNNIPLAQLVNPLDRRTTPLTSVLSQPQQIIAPSKSSTISDSEEYEKKLTSAISRAHIARLDEGPGTRMDFFEQVGLAFRTVKLVGLISLGLSGWAVYRRFTK